MSDAFRVVLSSVSHHRIYADKPSGSHSAEDDVIIRSLLKRTLKPFAKHRIFPLDNGQDVDLVGRGVG